MQKLQCPYKTITERAQSPRHLSAAARTHAGEVGGKFISVTPSEMRCETELCLPQYSKYFGEMMMLSPSHVSSHRGWAVVETTRERQRLRRRLCPACQGGATSLDRVVSTAYRSSVIIPERLEDWTYEVVARLAAEGRPETDRYDFKLGLPNPENLTKTCCAFANSLGGFLVFGVNQRDAAWSLDGLELDLEFASKFGKGVRADPTIQFVPPKVLPVAGRQDRALYVVHVPRSEVRPHLPSRAEDRFFWKRTNTGCERMTLEEVRTEFMGYEERREKLKLLVLELATNLRIIEDYTTQEPRGAFEVPSCTVLDRVLVDAYSIIQRDAELLRHLVEVQRGVRKSAARASFVYAQLAGARSAEVGGLIERHNGYLVSDHAWLRAQLRAALDILTRKFGFQDPLG